MRCTHHYLLRWSQFLNSVILVLDKQQIKCYYVNIEKGCGNEGMKKKKLGYRGREVRHCSAKAITVVRIHPVSFEWGSSSMVELQPVALAMLVQFQPVPLWWCSSTDRATACEAVDESSNLSIAFSGGIAQSAEQQPLKLNVAGSSPAAIINSVLFA